MISGVPTAKSRHLPRQLCPADTVTRLFIPATLTARRGQSRTIAARGARPYGALRGKSRGSS